MTAPFSRRPARTTSDLSSPIKPALKIFRLRSVTDEQAAVFFGTSLQGCAALEDGSNSGLEPSLETRLSLIFGRYRALQILLPDAERADAWVKAPNATFPGNSALDVMLSGAANDLVRVRAYLDAQCNCW